MRLFQILCIAVLLSIGFSFLLAFGIVSNNKNISKTEYVGALFNNKQPFIGTATAVDKNTLISCYHLNLDLGSLSYSYSGGVVEIIGISKYPELDLVVLYTKDTVPYRKIDKNITLEPNVNFVGYGSGATGVIQKNNQIKINWQTGTVNSFDSTIHSIENDTIRFKLTNSKDGMISYGDSGGSMFVNGSPVGMFQSFSESVDSDGLYTYTGYALDLRSCYDIIYGR
jgi:hypothetical protein